jgi:thiol-disulfide isomerase/thioredoxin
MIDSVKWSSFLRIPECLMPIDWKHIHSSALTYRAFLDKYATPEQLRRWDALHARVALTDAQKELLGSFVRPMPVLCMAGAWCGDCVDQCPIFDHFASASPVIDLRFIDRDADEQVRSALSVNGGSRVPVVLWLNEEGQEVSRFGDRTLSRYRELAAAQVGPSCPTGIVLPDDSAIAAVTREWLDEFERVHLILRLSPKYREQYGD